MIERGEERRFHELLAPGRRGAAVVRVGDPRARLSPGQGGRPASAEHLHRGHPLAAGQLLGHAGGGAGGRGVRARGDAGAAGAASVLARRGPLLPRAGEVARLPGAGQRLPDPGRGPADSRFTTTPTTSSCSRSPGASAGGCTSRCSSCRSRGQRWSPKLGDPGEAIRDFTLEAGRHALPAARLAARGLDVAGRVAAPHRSGCTRRPAWTRCGRRSRAAPRTTSSSAARQRPMVRCRRSRSSGSPPG